jgi:hypothetical protein
LNVEFLILNVEFLILNVEFLILNVEFLILNVEFLMNVAEIRLTVTNKPDKSKQKESFTANCYGPLVTARCSDSRLKIRLSRNTQYVTRSVLQNPKIQDA